MEKFFSVNRDIFLRTLCLISVMLFFTSAGSRQGETVLAVNALLMQFYMMFSYIMDGFAYAGEAISGRRYGAGNHKALRETVSALFRWSAGMTIGFTLAYALGGEAFISLLTSDRSVILASHEYMFWAVLMPMAGVAAFVWDGVFIGCTMTGGMLRSMSGATIAFFGVYFVARSSMGNHGLWLAFTLYMAMRGAIQTIIWGRRR